MLIKIIRKIARWLIHTVARIEYINFDRIPESGSAIVVTNHLGRLDAMMGAVLTNRDDVLMFIAEKYQKYLVWRWFARQFDAVWLNRFDVDLHAMRQAYKRLKAGEILAMAPEGTRSQTEALLPGKPGAAYLAAKTQALVIPLALTGTEDRVVKARLRRLKRLDITIRVGEPYLAPPMDRENRDAFLQTQTDEMMCRIAALLPEKYRGVYADHPRLAELLRGTAE
ncbi:MAG: lysophospholipid acyltransferase family protein [Anaerolineae bacterium]